MPNKSALIVDDSTTAQYRLKKMLRAYDLDIDAVDSGEAALRYLANNAPDVVFMDHLMPGMDGFRALQIIKSHPETAMIPVIMYTSKSGDVYTGQARALGALDVVSKDTINAADLSKVLEAIHIFRRDSQLQTTTENPETQEFIAAANAVSANAERDSETPEDSPQLERRALNRASMEQARNLELRISHLEHTLEDSRRFITSRVVRELHGLRDNLKQELSVALIQQHQPPAPPPTAPENPTTGSQRWPTFSILLILILLGVMAFYLTKMIALLEQSQDKQHLLNTQLQKLDEKQTAAILANKTIVSVPKNLMAEIVDNYADDNFLADLSWAFNQSGSLNFHQDTIEPKSLVSLHEFLRRLINKGFTGEVAIAIHVGNFCVAIDNVGIAQLPAATTLGNCILSSEIYGLDRVAEQYQQDITSALYGLTRDPVHGLQVTITTNINTEGYPERLPTVATKEWNGIAQANNRIELTLAAESTQQ